MDKSLSKPFTMCALIYWEGHEKGGRQSKPENTHRAADHTIVFQVSQRPAMSPVGLLPQGEQGEQNLGTLLGPFQ